MNASATATRNTAAPAKRDRPAQQEIAPGVCVLRIFMVNVYFVSGAEGWVLVDAGLPFSEARIRSAAEARFGARARPRAILMTHGHFDHVGALRTLAERWDVPVYAHLLELPYLTGRSKYPPPDPSVGGGLMARLSPLYPRGPVDLRGRAQPLPADGSVPFLPDWRALPTPGHTPGHVSFFRDADRTLIAGDAVVTVKQESASAVLTQRQAVHGPPAYYTQDWRQAHTSVRRLAESKPALLATGHGFPMSGGRMAQQLGYLAENFTSLAVPEHGRYVARPAIADEHGTVAVPPAPHQLGVPFALGAAAAALLLFGLRARRGQKRGG